MGYCCVGVVCVYLYYVLVWCVGQVVLKVFGEVQVVGVVVDVLVIVQYYGVYCVDVVCFGGEVVEQGDDCLFVGEGDVQFGEVEVVGGGEQEFQVVC